MTPPTVFITGTTTGIGLATARLLDQHGWRVFAGVYPGENTEALRGGASERLTVIPIDITKSAMVSAATETIQREVGQNGLQGLVNNAGVAVSGPLEFVPMDELRRQFEVNVFGHVAVTQACLPMLRAAKGRIVNTVSILGRVVTPFSGPYCMSKFAMQAFTDTLRLELSRFGIQVSAVEPGIINTPIWEKTIAQNSELSDEMPPGAQDFYGKSLAELRESMGQVQKEASEPIVIAQAIYHALTAPRPRTRYAVGSNAPLLAMLRWILPDRAMDWVIKGRYRLS
jgi:NAD(P)-dependent dehydrogenase (short-subunit alcohol dehydrogenase family)